jgi:hypothetical protein
VREALTDMVSVSFINQVRRAKMKLRSRKHKAYVNTTYDVDFGGAFRRGFKDKRCAEYSEGCSVCEYWRFFDAKKRFPDDYYEYQVFQGRKFYPWIKKGEQA